MIGPIFYPRRRRPPSAVARPPYFERRVKARIGWLVERLTAPLGRWEREVLRTPEVPVPIAGLSPELAGYRIALLTDLHNGPAVPHWWLAQAVERVTSLAPDLIALGGDFVSHARSDLDGLESLLAGLHAPDGVVAVLGNHDHWVGPELVADVVRRAGAELLLNRHRVIHRGLASLAVAGVDDLAHGAVRVADALEGVPASTPVVLLSHNPDLVEYLPPDLRIDLMLSGHTHNGQLHWPLIGPLTVPSQFGRRYLHGLHHVRDTWLYVSAGVGSGAIPIRWGNPTELPVLRLVPA